MVLQCIDRFISVVRKFGCKYVHLLHLKTSVKRSGNKFEEGKMKAATIHRNSLPDTGRRFD